MKGIILKSEYNPGFDSWIMKETKYGTFVGRTTVQDEDNDIDNSFDGMKIANAKADVQAYKARAKEFRLKAEGAKIVYQNLSQANSGDWLDKIKKQVDYLEREAKKAEENYQISRDYLPIFIESLLKQRRQIREHKFKDMIAGE